MNFDLPTGTLAGAIVLAVLAAAIRFVIDTGAARRRRQLDRCSAQLERLYGPLHALSHASEVAWAAFREAYASDRSAFFSSDRKPSKDELEAWVIWIRAVFMPLNERMERVITENSHLLEESSMPACLLELCAHVESYRGVIAEWEAKRFDKLTATNNYPVEINAYARRVFADLKARQAGLIESGA